jgi:hypothetical protein
MYNFAPFMIVTPALEGPKPLYEGVYMFGEHGQGVYFLT